MTNHYRPPKFVTNTKAQHRRHVVGLDLSLNRTGLATSERTYSITPSSTLGKGVGQELWILDTIGSLIPPQCPLVVIESALIHGGHIQGAVRLIGMHRLVIHRLHQTRRRYVHVPIGTLKKFATGDGHAKKPALVKVAKAQAHHPIANDDESDAFHLRRLGILIMSPKLHEATVDTDLDKYRKTKALELRGRVQR